MHKSSRPTTKRQWVTGRGLAEQLGISVHTPRAWRARGMGPTYHRLGGQIVYFQDDIDAWLAAGMRVPARSHGGAA